MEIRKDILIILSTGLSELISEKIAEEMGVSSLVMKPVVISKLAPEIRKVLG